MNPLLGAATLFDRASERRADPHYLAALASEPAARFLLLVGGKASIVSNAELARVRWFTKPELDGLGVGTNDAMLLGTEGGAGRFAVAVQAEPDAPRLEAVKPLVDLRSLANGGTMSAGDLSLLGEAKALADWHETSRFCGACGGATALRDGGWRRVCERCGREHFPRVDPVVIMLVTDGARCVLGREARFPPGMYSALAGFVEPGEDIEHAVRRETREEVGVEVGAVTYALSQPWPFPHSLMIGCFAQALSADLAVNTGELEFARWFKRDEVGRMLEGIHEQDLSLPGRYAIAHALVRRWLEIPTPREFAR